MYCSLCVFIAIYKYTDIFALRSVDGWISVRCVVLRPPCIDTDEVYDDGGDERAYFTHLVKRWTIRTLYKHAVPHFGHSSFYCKVIDQLLAVALLLLLQLLLLNIINNNILLVV